MESMHKFFDRTVSSALRGPICCVLHGLGGQGKSQTALEYAHRYHSSYGAIFWLKSETEQELTTSYADIIKKTQLLESEERIARPSDGEVELSQCIEDACDWLEGTS